MPSGTPGAPPTSSNVATVRAVRPSTFCADDSSGIARRDSAGTRTPKIEETNRIIAPLLPLLGLTLYPATTAINESRGTGTALFSPVPSARRCIWRIREHDLETKQAAGRLRAQVALQ